MKKEVLISVIVSVVVTFLLTFGGFMLFSNNKDDKVTNTNEELKQGFTSIKEVDFTPQKFTVVLMGIVSSSLSDPDVADLKKYELDVVTSDGYTKEKHKYVGIKVKDFLEKYLINDYNKIIFKSTGNLQVAYPKEEVDDNLYLVFAKDGHEIAKNGIGVLNPTLNERYSTTEIVRIDFD